MEVFKQGARMVMITITYLIFLVFKRKCIISISWLNKNTSPKIPLEYNIIPVF